MVASKLIGVSCFSLYLLYLLDSHCILSSNEPLQTNFNYVFGKQAENFNNPSNTDHISFFNKYM